MRVAVIGAAGRMGSTTCAAVEAADGLELVARIDLGDDVASGLAGADVAVVFSVPGAAVGNVLACVGAGVHAVVGTTGWTEASLGRVRGALRGTDLGVLVAPNFAIGAVLLVDFAARAARHFESVEVIELHHPDKVDAPSGTAQHTARAIAAARRGLSVCRV